MKTNRKASDAPPAQKPDQAAPRARQRRIDRIDQPARPLGTKRAALHVRRQQLTGHTGLRAPSSGHSGRCTLTSQDGAVSFTLNPSSNGLLIDRSQRQAMGTRLVQTLVFVDQAAFDRWCSVEPLRFEDALLFGQLVRVGHGAFHESG